MIRRSIQSPVARSALLLGLLLVPGTVPGAAQESVAGVPAVVALPPELDVVLREYEDAWGRRDADALTALFTEDGFVLRPGRPPVQGREAIRIAYANSGGPLTLRAYGHATEGSVGWIVGGFATSPEGPDVGKFVLALRKAPSGRWLLAADMDNGNSR